MKTATVEPMWLDRYLDFSLPDALSERRERKGIERSLTTRASEAVAPLTSQLNPAVWLRRDRLFRSLVIIAVILVLLLILIFTGLLGTAYNNYLIVWTSNGKPWTYIMRDNWWIFWVVSIPVVLLLFFLVPRKAYGRLWLVLSMFFIGFLGGHVFW
ncbi:MAG: hypothetical protein ACC652_14810 [Acidimicrobiales bacterium]